MQVFVQVAAADAAEGRADEDVRGAERARRRHVLDPEIVAVVEANGPHGGCSLLVVPGLERFGVRPAAAGVRGRLAPLPEQVDRHLHDDDEDEQRADRQALQPVRRAIGGDPADQEAQGHQADEDADDVAAPAFQRDAAHQAGRRGRQEQRVEAERRGAAEADREQRPAEAGQRPGKGEGDDQRPDERNAGGARFGAPAADGVDLPPPDRVAEEQADER